MLRSYCAAGDPICAGGDDVTEHLNYFELYTDAASSWAVGKVDAAAPLCGASSSSAVSVATPTASTPASSAVVTSAPVVSSAAESVSAPAATSTSPCSVAPFPPVQPYPTDSCVVIYEVQYVYA